MTCIQMEVDLTKIYEGTTVAVKWRGKPVFVRNRTQREIDAAKADDDVLMKDPQPDEMRVKKAQWLIVLGICTHLGCVPLANEGNWKGWFCPCHGSHYDTSGRIRLGTTLPSSPLSPFLSSSDPRPSAYAGALSPVALAADDSEVGICPLSSSAHPQSDPLTLGTTSM